MYHKRKDKECEARILAYNADTDRVLIEVRWPNPKGNNPNRNIVNVSADYFETKYGVNPRGR